MARRSRQDLPGSWHHVVNRGIPPRLLFDNRLELRFFLARLARQVRLGRLEVHAFCLLPTHFHLLVRSPVGQLSEAMRRVQGEYARHSNRSRLRDGALVPGRYVSERIASEAYCTALVRYVDALAVRAGIVGTSGDYEFGSAHHYLRGIGPRWLCRTWVEARACALAAEPEFDAGVYERAFGVESSTDLDALVELVEQRSASRASVDPLRDLHGTTRADLHAWLEQRARLADGYPSGLPVCADSALRAALDADEARHGRWIVERGELLLLGRELTWVGFLHDLCGRSWREIADLTGGSVTRARRLAGLHRSLLGSDAAYAARAVAIGRTAVARSITAAG